MRDFPFNRRILDVRSGNFLILNFRKFDFLDQDIKISRYQNIKFKNIALPTSKIQGKIFAGFTLIELLIVMALMGILMSFVIVNVSKAQRSTSVITTEDAFIADLRLQQAKAMNSVLSPSGSNNDFGVYIQPTQYILFQGTSYDPTDPGNTIVELDGNLQLSTTFPSSTIVFSRMTGEVVGFVDGSNTVTMRNTVGSEVRTVVLNRLGVVVGN